MRKPLHPSLGLLAGLFIVTVAALVRARTGDPLDFPLPVWMAGLVFPGVGLVTGGYLKSFKSPLISAEMESLPEAPQTRSSDDSPPDQTLLDWTLQRANEYAKVDGYMLAHVYRRSQMKGQAFDIFIFLVRHRKGTDAPPLQAFPEIAKVEFFFGESWDNQVFEVTNDGGAIGIRTHAWGTFLATCRVAFRAERDPIILHRYIDFHMLQDNLE